MTGLDRSSKTFFFHEIKKERMKKESKRKMKQKGEMLQEAKLNIKNILKLLVLKLFILCHNELVQRDGTRFEVWTSDEGREL